MYLEGDDGQPETLISERNRKPAQNPCPSALNTSLLPSISASRAAQLLRGPLNTTAQSQTQDPGPQAFTESLRRCCRAGCRALVV